MLAGWILGFTAAALLAPSVNYQIFSGLPLSTWPEYVAAVLLLVVAVHRGLRRLAARAIRRAPRAGRLLLGCSAVALVLKLALLSSGDYRGWLGCYSSPLVSPPAGRCETSYENPFRRFGVTRVDQQIAFEPGTWNLSFLNSLPFSYPWAPGNRRRERLPIDVGWSGSVRRVKGGMIVIDYTGEGRVRVGDESVALEPSYRHVRTTTVPMPAGSHQLRVQYHFDDHSQAMVRPDGPYASIRVRFLALAGTPTEVEVGSERRALGWTLVAYVADGAIACLGLALAALLLGVCRRDIVWALPIAVATWAAPHFVEGTPPIAVLKVLTAASLVLLLVVLGRRRARRLVTAALMLAGVGLVAATPLFVSLRTVDLRDAGDDWLTYESQARSILNTWSLEGGERVFYYQPLWRYVKFAQHVLLGDGDALILASELTLLTLAIIWMLRRFHRRGSRASTVVTVTAGILLLTIACSGTGAFGFLRLGASETMAWVMLPVLMAALFTGRSPRAGLAGTVLVGLSALTRLDHVPALTAVFGAFLARQRQRHRATLPLVALVGALLLLPLVHNVVFGGRYLPFTRSAGDAQTYIISPQTVLAAWHDPAARAAVMTQVRYMFALAGTDERWVLLGPALHALELLWIGTVVWILMTSRVRWSTVLLALTPAAYLGVHLFYVAHVYYPRHILAAHVMMGTVAALLVSEKTRRDTTRNRA